MLELLFKGLFQWIYELFLELVQFVSNALLGVFSMDLSYFMSVVPVAKDIMLVLQAVGWALLLGNLVFQASKSMMSGLGFEGEDPKLLFFRTFVFSFFLAASGQICDVGLSLTKQVIDLLSVPSSVTVQIPAETIFNTGAAWLLIIIIGIVVGWQFIKLCIEVGERYVVLSALTILAPLAFGIGGSRNTSDIFKGWARMYGSMCFMMISNVIFLKMLISALGYVPTGMDAIPWAILIVGIAKVARKVDEIITRIGLNPAITGSGLGRNLPGMLALTVARGMTSAVTKTIGAGVGGGGKTGAASSSSGGGKRTAGAPHWQWGAKSGMGYTGPQGGPGQSGKATGSQAGETSYEAAQKEAASTFSSPPGRGPTEPPSGAAGAVRDNTPGHAQGREAPTQDRDASGHTQGKDAHRPKEPVQSYGPQRSGERRGTDSKTPVPEGNSPKQGTQSRRLAGSDMSPGGVRQSPSTAGGAPHAGPAASEREAAEVFAAAPGQRTPGSPTAQHTQPGSDDREGWRPGMTRRTAVQPGAVPRSYVTGNSAQGGRWGGKQGDAPQGDAPRRPPISREPQVSQTGQGPMAPGPTGTGAKDQRARFTAFPGQSVKRADTATPFAPGRTSEAAPTTGAGMEGGKAAATDIGTLHQGGMKSTINQTGAQPRPTRPGIPRQDTTAPTGVQGSSTIERAGFGGGSKGSEQLRSSSELQSTPRGGQDGPGSSARPAPTARTPGSPGGAIPQPNVGASLRGGQDTASHRERPTPAAPAAARGGQEQAPHMERPPIPRGFSSGAGQEGFKAPDVPAKEGAAFPRGGQDAAPHEARPATAASGSPRGGQDRVPPPMQSTARGPAPLRDGQEPALSKDGKGPQLSGQPGMQAVAPPHKKGGKKKNRRTGRK